MNCYFCSSSDHLSENCNIYPTLDSRYKKLNYTFMPCLCQNFKRTSKKRYQQYVILIEHCRCRNFCDVCLQKHHIALCPRKDPSHPYYSNDLTDSLDFFKLDYHVIKRFLTLCNPVDKAKFYLSCKYLNQILQPLEYKLVDCLTRKSLESKSICIGEGQMFRSGYLGLNISQWPKTIYINFQSFYMSHMDITKFEAKMLFKSDLCSVKFQDCVFQSGYTFRDCLESLPYVIELELTDNMLPQTWVNDLLIAKRHVSIRQLHINVHNKLPETNLDELVQLLMIQPVMLILFFIYKKKLGGKDIEEMMNHKSISLTSDDIQRRIKFLYVEDGFKFKMYALNGI